ncbi:MAG: hypothetical protein IPM47_10495 [Sphingobacteriales bacterium]|nr:MAG: hypothetical protein IPM47_10495 [Sphingobacteriales bacterium]
MSKLYSLLQTLDTTERKRFTQYLHSPFFHSANVEMPEKLLTVLINTPPKNEPGNDALAAILFPEKEVSKAESFVRKCKSELYRLLLQFLAHSTLLEDKAALTRAKLAELGRRKQNKIYEEQWKVWNSEYQKKQVSGSFNYYEEDYMLHLDYYNHHLASDNRYPEANELRFKIARKLDVFYLATQLQWLVVLLSGQDIVYPLPADEHEKTGFKLQNLLYMTEAVDCLSEPIVKIYYHLANLFLKQNTHEHLARVKDWLNEYVQIAARADLIPVCKLACNYCIGEFKRGNTGFLADTDFFYEFRFAHRLLPEEGGRIVPADFKNIVTIKCRLGLFREASEFILQYGHCLPASHKELPAYCNGQIAFYAGDFEKATEFLEQVERKDNLDYLQVTRLLIKSYFGMLPVKSDLLLSKLKTVETRLYQLEKEKRITSGTKNVQLVFTTFCNKLLKIAMFHSGRQTSEKLTGLGIELYNEIETQYNFADKDWLLATCKRITGI